MPRVKSLETLLSAQQLESKVSELAEQINRERAVIFSKARRRKIRENNKLARQLNDVLLQENEQLKRQLELARERLEDLNNGKY